MTYTEVKTAIKPNSLEDLYRQLADIDAAIHAILAGAQEYVIGSRRLKRADLGVLYEMRKDTVASIIAIESSGNFFDNTYVAYWPEER